MRQGHAWQVVNTVVHCTCSHLSGLHGHSFPGIFGSDTDTVSFYDSGWTAGAYYYFTVDVDADGSVGTFTICLTDTD